MTLATCAKDVKFYKFPSLTLLGVYETSDDCMCVKSLSWSNDAKQLIVIKSRGPPTVLVAPTRLEETIEPSQYIPKSTATVATFGNTKSRLVAFGGVEGEVTLYDIRKKRNIAEYHRLPTTVQNLEFSPDDKLLAAGCINGQLFLYNHPGKPCASFMVPNSYTLSAVAYHKFIPDILAASSKEGVTCVWDVETFNSKLIGKDHANLVTDIGFHEVLMSTVGVDGKLVSYDMRAFKHNLCYNLKTPLASLAYNPNSFEMAIGTCDGQLRTYDSRFMSTPLNTVVAYNTWIKKIAFPQINVSLEDTKTVMMEPTTTHNINQKKTSRHTNLFYEDTKTASGDFTNFSDTTSMISQKTHLPPSASVADIQINGDAVPQIFAESELQELARSVEEKIKQSKAQFEEKLLQTFYGMRINASKQFIGIEDRVAQSWNNFVDCLKHSGEQSVKHSERKGDVPVGSNYIGHSRVSTIQDFFEMQDGNKDEN